jgi:hypothetical protein
MESHGIGADPFTAGYEWLDLDDVGIVGRRRLIARHCATWMPVARVCRTIGVRPCLDGRFDGRCGR